MMEAALALIEARLTCIQRRECDGVLWRNRMRTLVGRFDHRIGIR